MIEKLVKEFEKIRTSLAKSKKLIIADIDKIDEKYRKLAQEEKKSLTDSLAVLNEQLKYYDKMLDGESVAEDAADEGNETDSAENTSKTEEEPVIEDTIFPENNEPEVKEEAKEEVVENTENANNDWFGEENAESSKKEDEEPVPVVTTDDNGWPIPEDWK